MEERLCDCCKQWVPEFRMDRLYGCCAWCAVEQSLGNYPCDHGVGEGRKLAPEPHKGDPP